MQLLPNNAALVTYTTCVLHNLLIAKRPHEYLNRVSAQAAPNAPDLQWHDADMLLNLQRLRGHTDLKAAKVVRDHLRAYYNSPSGAVEWQDRLIFEHVS